MMVNISFTLYLKVISSLAFTAIYRFFFFFFFFFCQQMALSAKTYDFGMIISDPRRGCYIVSSMFIFFFLFFVYLLRYTSQYKY